MHQTFEAIIFSDHFLLSKGELVRAFKINHEIVAMGDMPHLGLTVLGQKKLSEDLHSKHNFCRLVAIPMCEI